MPGDWPPIVADDDPPESHLAADLIQPTRPTKRTLVMQLLCARWPDWVTGYEVTEVGGSEGLRRLRELRQIGVPIQRRPVPGNGRTSWEYRLGEDDDR